MVGGLLTKKHRLFSKSLVKMSQLAQKLVLIYIFDDLFGTENHRSNKDIHLQTSLSIGTYQG